MSAHRYVEAGYWVRGYAEGDYVDAALSANAASTATVGPNFLINTAAQSSAVSSTVFSPYRVKFAGVSSSGLSGVDLGVNRYRLVGVLPEGASVGNASLSKTMTVSGATVSADGVMQFSGRLKWEAEPEPGDTWTDKVEPTGIWTDRLEPGDTWSDT